MDLDLEALRKRVLAAQTHGFSLAYAEDYVKQLGGGAPPDGVAANSPEHVLHLIANAGKPTLAPKAPEKLPELVKAPESKSGKKAKAATPEPEKAPEPAPEPAVASVVAPEPAAEPKKAS
jgi:outer membrane biosynthesis protein TonB